MGAQLTNGPETIISQVDTYFMVRDSVERIEAVAETLPDGADDDAYRRAASDLTDERWNIADKVITATATGLEAMAARMRPLSDDGDPSEAPSI